MEIKVLAFFLMKNSFYLCKTKSKGKDSCKENFAILTAKEWKKERVVKLNNHALKVKLYFKFSIRCNTRSGRGMSKINV